MQNKKNKKSSDGYLIDKPRRKYKKNPVLYLIKKFGGLRAAAREIGRAPSGIHRWKTDRAIPKLAFPLIFKAAKRNGLTLWDRKLK